jgi:RNA polymerase sigma-70 factor (ECF subfamily)
MEDNETVAACLRGEKEAFRRIMDKYIGPALAMAINVLGNRQDAEDACQEAFVQAYKNLGRFDAQGSLRTWLLTIVYRRCLDQAKRKKRFRSAFEKVRHEVPLTTRSEADTRAGDRGPRLPELWLRRLSPRERTALCLWADEGFTAAEIAGVLGCAASTARVTLFNARRKIKSSLENAHAAH